MSIKLMWNLFYSVTNSRLTFPSKRKMLEFAKEKGWKIRQDGYSNRDFVVIRK